MCFLENYGCHEVDFGVKMTARPFSKIHLLMDQFSERDFIIFFLLLKIRVSFMDIFQVIADLIVSGTVHRENKSHFFSLM